MTLDDAKDIATIIGVGIAVVGFAKAVFEYVQQGVQKRAQAYFDLERSFWKDESLTAICKLLEDDDPALATIPLATKILFVAFHEDVALMLNSKLLSEGVAHYMFGYYAILCDASVHFWKGEYKMSPYWSLFRSFVERMKKFEKGFHFGSAKLRF